MREATLTIKLRIADGVTEEQVHGWATTMGAIASEPVYDHDESGNEKTFSARLIEVGWKVTDVPRNRDADRVSVTRSEGQERT